MTDRDSPTLLPPPPSDPFVEPPSATDTEPPVNPAVLAALRVVIREEVQLAVGAVAKQWGEAFVAEQSRGDRIQEIAENAVRQSAEAVKLCADLARGNAERERTAIDALLSVNENLRSIRAYLTLPEHGSIADLAKQAGQ